MFKKIIMFILLAVILTSAALYFFLVEKNPQREGELKLSGLENSVTVSYDHYGIPHIKANSDPDLYRAFGYVHAQDRLFQMELTRRLSQGKLAEILGEDLVPVDKLFRTLGIGEYAKKWRMVIEKRADPKMLENIQSYLDGVNEFVENGSTPVEFHLMGIPKHKYTADDVFSIGGFIAFSFAQGLQDDPLLTHLSLKLGEDYLKDLGILYTPGFEQLPVDSMVTTQLSSEVSQIVGDLQFTGLFHGSNSWLIAPKRSESGKAILVNDPHIAFSQPSVWYEAQLSSETTEIYGHFMGLIPMALLGMTKEHAWGITMFENDDMDLYAEKVNPENPNQYWAIDHWQDFEKSIEVIKVKGSEDVSLEILKSRHGVIVNNMFDGTEEGNAALDKATQPIALWWSFIDTDNQMMEAFYQFPKADTLEKAAKASSMIHAPGLNMMYANEKGDIAWWASAKLPIRPAHVNPKFILDGSTGNDDILGFYDFSYNPKKINPESGVLYTANNQPADMGNGLVPGYYSPTDRPTRIVKMLSEKEKFNPEDMKKMLMDNVTPTAQFFQQIIIPVISARESELNAEEKLSLEYFSKWKANHSSNEVAATVYTRFRMSLMRLAMEDEMGKEMYENFQFGFLMNRTIWRMLDNQSSPWWDNVETTEIETRDELILAAWKESNQFLVKRFGKDVSQWTWGNDIKMIHEHPLGKISWLEKLFNVGPFPSEAGIEAVNNLWFKQAGDELTVFLGPSTRRIIDFADVENSWGINPTGQSGVFTDHHYQDQALDYSKGIFRHQYITEEKVKENLESVLVFYP